MEQERKKKKTQRPAGSGKESVLDPTSLDTSLPSIDQALESIDAVLNDTKDKADRPLRGCFCFR